MKMNRNYLKQILIYAGTVLLFAVLAYSFVPQVFSGKVLNQSDSSAWKGMTREISEHNKANPDDKTLWTNSMFGGMPTVTMYDDFDGDWTEPLYKALMSGARPANYLFVSLIVAFLLMLAFGTDRILSIAGAIAITFCSYNFQIIQVGHNTKMQAIAFMPWVLAAFVFTYRSALSASGGWKRWLPKTVLGSVLFAFALSFQIKANHPQITYYLAIIILIYTIAQFVSVCLSRTADSRFVKFFAASALLLVIGGTGIATNLNKLIPTYQYAKYTMRGGSELSPSSETHNDKGLDLEYATAWSYGIEETPNLMIPNFNGGASSGALDRKSETYKLLKQAGQPNLNQVIKHLPLYWGPQPFTAGPMYMGAISIFLFVLGLCIFRGKEKWWLLAATIIAVLLAWGNHFMWFTRLWFDYAPMYNKFRTVSMALVILQITLPVLGFLVLDRIFKGEYHKKELLKGIYISYGITAGFCLLCALVPSIAGTFTGAADAGQPDILVDALAADRRSLLVKDAIQSFIVISIVMLLIIWTFRTKEQSAVKGRTVIASVAICLAVWLNMFTVGKRYLNKDNFVTKKDFSSQFAQRPVDKLILQDDDPYYRVLDISVNTFNDAHQSYHHKCIGGYSPAKLQRYQDLIDRYLIKEINATAGAAGNATTIQDVENNLPYLPVTSMLNGKYIIIVGEYPPVENRNAFGNAWFVDSYVPADTPDREIALIGSTDLKTTAIIGKDFENVYDRISAAASDEDYIELSSYSPNELHYRYNVESDRAVIFSEIYYPEGWKAYIIPEKDGLPGEMSDIELFRADWILRGAVLPEGEGELVMRFDPQSYRTGAALSRASSITLIVLLLLSVCGLTATSLPRGLKVHKGDKEE